MKNNSAESAESAAGFGGFSGFRYFLGMKDDLILLPPAFGAAGATRRGALWTGWHEVDGLGWTQWTALAAWSHKIRPNQGKTNFRGSNASGKFMKARVSGSPTDLIRNVALREPSLPRRRGGPYFPRWRRRGRAWVIIRPNQGRPPRQQRCRRSEGADPFDRLRPSARPLTRFPEPNFMNESILSGQIKAGANSQSRACRTKEVAERESGEATSRRPNAESDQIKAEAKAQCRA